jgi:UDP-N-acetylmuramate-alanine ligase
METTSNEIAGNMNYENIYFLGIGGIGMSALARYFKSIGKNVSGYDKTETELTNALIESGIDIHFKDEINLIPTDYYIENTGTLDELKEKIHLLKKYK